MDSIFRVHRSPGPELLESVYCRCLQYELTKRGLRAERESPVAIVYDGMTLDSSLKIDLLVEDCIIVEAKSVEKRIPLYEAQLLTYMKLKHIRVGFLVNFNVELIRDGIHRKIP